MYILLKSIYKRSIQWLIQTPNPIPSKKLYFSIWHLVRIFVVTTETRCIIYYNRGRKLVAGLAKPIAAS